MAKIVITDIREVRAGDKVYYHDTRYGGTWSGIAFHADNPGEGNPLYVGRELLSSGSEYFVKATRPGLKFPKKWQSVVIVDEDGETLPAIRVGCHDDGRDTEGKNLWMVVYDDGSFRTVPQKTLVLKEVLRSG